MPLRMELNICNLYPDVLSSGGDRGNIICMQKRLLWRGIDSVVTNVPSTSAVNFSDFDLFYIGGAPDFERLQPLPFLEGGAPAELRAAVEDEQIFLAIGGGYQLLGSYYKTTSGVQRDFLGAADVYTLGSDSRFTGDYLFDSGEDCASKLVGFENHGGRTYLGSGAKPLGMIICGSGNNGEDKTEGLRYKNIFGTYAGGPFLPKNPRMADFILQTAISRKYGDTILAELDDKLEVAAHDYMESRLSAN